MVRTQVQFPDELYAALKGLAEEKEWSLAEVLRRASEEYLVKYPAGRAPKGTWKMPGPYHVGGDFLVPPESMNAEAEAIITKSLYPDSDDA